MYIKKVLLIDTCIAADRKLSLSNYLGQKYKGWPFQLDLYAINPSNQNKISKLSSIIKYSPTVSTEESTLINKCIKIWEGSL